MTEEEKKENWWKIIVVVLATFLGAFLAFYFAVDIALSRMSDPVYHMKKMEKMLKQNERDFYKMERSFGENPFEPKLAPMLVNLVKEPTEYKLIVDLKPLDGNEKNVKLNFDNNIVTVSGSMEMSEHHRENILKFSQSYFLDEKVDMDKIVKEKKGNKYIISVPFED